MIALWFMVFLFISIAIMIVVLPLCLQSKEPLIVDVNESQNLRFKEQIKEIDDQIEQNILTSSIAEELKVELAKNFLSDKDHTSQMPLKTITENKWIVVCIIGLLVPLMAFGLYVRLGSYVQLEAKWALEDPNLTQESLTVVLEKWYKKQPDDEQVNYLLSNQYLSTKRFDQAIKVLQRQYQMVKNDVNAVKLAKAFFLKNNSKMNDTINGLVTESLTINPYNVDALGLKGIAASERKDYKSAIEIWTQALQVESSPEIQRSLKIGIQYAKSQLGLDVPNLKVRVSLSADIIDKIPTTTKVVIFAQQQSGGIPLAVKSVLVSQLPMQINLDDTDSMPMSQKKLSDVREVNLIATISLNGDVTQPNFRGKVAKVDVFEKKITEVIIKTIQ